MGPDFIKHGVHQLEPVNAQ